MATRPGFHASTNFKAYPADLSNAIRAIGKQFYVTKSFDEEVIGKSTYWGLLARPSDDFSVHLNVDREILFLFSAYKDFEIRTLEAFDRFYNQVDGNRVDKSIRFLISGDVRIESNIQRYLIQNPEYPIIVPIILNNVGVGESEILKAIRRNYLLRDLFGYQNPLREDSFFFGREEQVKDVLDLAKSGQSSSIFGLRKSGKTSTIYAIMRKSKSFDCIPVFIDCQSPAVHARKYNELLSQIINEIRQSIGQNKKLPLLTGSDAEVSDKFRDQMKTALGHSKNRFLIIFDEIENITPKTAASDHWNVERDSLLFWQNLRSFIQKDANGKLAICLVGTSPSLLEMSKINDVANPMYLFSQKRFIPSFSFEETKEMIDRLGFFMGLEFEPTQVAKLQKNYGGHPFFIRQVCSNIHGIAGGSRPVSVSDRQVDAAIEKFGGQLNAYLEEILGNLRQSYPEEFNLLGSIVKGDSSEISEYGLHAPELIDHLTGYGLVERRSDSVDIRFDAVKSALQKIFYEKSPEDIWKECMLRRNRLEADIRREILVMSKNMNEMDWENLLVEALSRRRFDALASKEPRILFSKTSSPLYWTDLISIIKSDNALNYLGERKSAILSAMNTVNFLGRKDSHANEVRPEEVEMISSAFGLLEDEFSQPS